MTVFVDHQGSIIEILNKDCCFHWVALHYRVHLVFSGKDVFLKPSRESNIIKLIFMKISVV